MTPAEVYATIDAYLWREEAAQKREIATAWRTAVLGRAKRIPPLRELLTPKDAKILTGDELEKRQREFEEMSSAANLDAIRKRT